MSKVVEMGSVVSLSDYLVEKRRYFHQHPELGFHEYGSAQVIQAELESLGYEIKSGIASTGLIGICRAGDNDQVILLRFDMDALPISEENDLDFISKNEGVMHACGHDAHMSIGLGIAREFMALVNKPLVTLMLLFQPAEEGLGGAKAMIAEGVLSDPTPDYTLAIHVWNEKEVGWAAITPGVFMAGADTFTIQVVGKGGHGALPQETIDPVLAAVQIVQSIQSIVSRNLSPLENGVVSTCSIHGGSVFNVIPQMVELKGTIRYFQDQTRNTIHRRLQELAVGVASAFGCEAKITLNEITPAVVNNPSVVNTILTETVVKFPHLQVDSDFRSLVSEDFAFFLNQIPGCFMFFGSSVRNEKHRYGHHHPKFDIDEDVMPLAVSFLLQAVNDLAHYLPERKTT